jgi:hypothetical protein
MSEADRKRLKALAQEQKGLQKRAQKLRSEMEEVAQMAPLFGDEAMQQMGEVGQRMGEAAQRMDAREAGKAHGEQKAALDQLQQLQENLRKQGGKGRGRGLPLPMQAGGRQQGFGDDPREKVEIPDADQHQAPKEFRKDLLDAMKQPAPEKYKDQVKRYYEELVK